MLKHAKKPLELVIPSNIEAVYRMYRKSLRSLIKRNKNGKSIRKLAILCKISDPALGYMFKSPEKRPSRKVMIKIIRGTTRPKKKKILERGGISGWCPNAI
jgi:hypothetical protein